ncbi:UPF0235 protein C15orf40 homolog [Plectropomus leopardus]|uniref:UPF0235 protein C15orf40 homolog n=1 Tax=Plectropomus leopardus TaxID=160734 RepID=UPI001C4C5E97|nr:UPF0235 protein C15orf40 homolog [Plectropomus leopardus]
MFLRSGVTFTFIRLPRSFRSFGAVTLNQLPDVVPLLSRPLAAVSRCGPPALPGARRLTALSANRRMPKKEKAQVRGRPAAPAAAEAEASCPVARDKSGAVMITVRAKPGSKHSAIAEVSAEVVGVSIAAPPTDGEANAELLRLFADVLQLKKSHVSLDKGSRSRDKLIRVDSSLSPDEVLRRLRQAAG